ncbi:NAD-dependent epimerase/dehydratase family protein [Bacteroidota bacterium]
MNTNAVITGANGFIGSHLVDYLIVQKNRIKCITRKTSNIRWLKNKPVEIFDCGLFDKNKLRVVLEDCDVLYHVAGVVKAKSEEGYYTGNVETTKNLLDTILEVNPNIKRIVILSSQTAVGPSTGGQPVNEDSIPNPITTYGKSKLEQEELVRSYMDKLPITIVRAPAIYGERDTEIYLVFKTYKHGLMTLIGFNKKLVSLIHVTDLVKGIYLAAQNEKAVNQTYFISSKEFYNWRQVGDIIGKELGRKALTISIPHFIVYSIAGIAQFFSMFSNKAATFNIEKAKDFVQEFWTCDISKAEKELGYTQEISIEEGVRRTIGWYKENNWL